MNIFRIFHRDRESLRKGVIFSRIKSFNNTDKIPNVLLYKFMAKILSAFAISRLMLNNSFEEKIRSLFSNKISEKITPQEK